MRPHRVKGGLCRKVTCRLIPELDQEGAKEDGGKSASGLGARDLGAVYLWGTTIQPAQYTPALKSQGWLLGDPGLRQVTLAGHGLSLDSLMSEAGCWV